MSKVTVFGAGAWGSTMAQVLCDAGNDVLLWGRNQEVIDEINGSHTNAKYLAHHTLPAELKATSRLDQALFPIGSMPKTMSIQILVFFS
jgi:glycerol-3-phosphate dehydrogenase (NAD(P)+)